MTLSGIAHGLSYINIVRLQMCWDRNSPHNIHAKMFSKIFFYLFADFRLDVAHQTVICGLQPRRFLFPLVVCNLFVVSTYCSRPLRHSNGHRQNAAASMMTSLPLQGTLLMSLSCDLRLVVVKSVTRLPSPSGIRNLTYEGIASKPNNFGA